MATESKRPTFRHGQLKVSIDADGVVIYGTCGAWCSQRGYVLTLRPVGSGRTELRMFTWRIMCFHCRVLECGCRGLRVNRATSPCIPRKLAAVVHPIGYHPFGYYGTGSLTMFGAAFAINSRNGTDCERRRQSA